MMLLTTLPAETADPDRVLALYRLRWQIELAFKRLKSLLHIDRLTAKDPRLARCWLAANLVAALLIDRMSQDFRSEEHTSELQSLMRTSYAVFCLTKKNK